MKIPRMMLAAAGSDSGKTLLTCGILQAFLDRGKAPVACKCGPDYIDPMFHEKVLGIPGRNLDLFLMGEEGVKTALEMQGRRKDLVVIEGVMGFYDGLGGIQTDGSAWEVAKTTKTPVFLILNAKGVGTSILAMLKGFLSYRTPSMIQGVILNRISGAMYPRIKEGIEKEFGIPVCGYLPEMKEISIPGRHLGLLLPDEIEGLTDQIKEVAKQMEETLELDLMLEIAKTAPEPDGEVQPAKEPSEKIRIGCARDEAFSFIYKDNLEVLMEMGAEIVFFSPLHDSHLPKDLKGLLLYGGYPELYAKELEENQSMRQEIKKALEKGTPCLAECGGFLYLQETLTDQEGRTYSMVGYLKGHGYPTGRLTRFGYVWLEEKGTSLFERKNIEGDEEKKRRIPAHEFHYYDSDECGNGMLAKKPTGNKEWECMVSRKNLLAGFPHLHYRGCRQVAEAFMEVAENDKRRSEENM